MVCGRGRTCCFHGWLWRRSCRPWRCDLGAYVCWQPLRAESCVSPCCAGKESKDHEKENVRRIKEIQKKCKERERAQERSQPKPVKALWKSQKYENVESKVKARLQVGSQGAPQLCCQGRRRKSHHGFCLPPPARPFCPRNLRAVLGVVQSSPQRIPVPRCLRLPSQPPTAGARAPQVTALPCSARHWGREGEISLQSLCQLSGACVAHGGFYQLCS